MWDSLGNMLGPLLNFLEESGLGLHWTHEPIFPHLLTTDEISVFSLLLSFKIFLYYTSSNTLSKMQFEVTTYLAPRPSSEGDSQAEH